MNDIGYNNFAKYKKNQLYYFSPTISLGDSTDFIIYWEWSLVLGN